MDDDHVLHPDPPYVPIPPQCLSPALHPYHLNQYWNLLYKRAEKHFQPAEFSPGWQEEFKPDLVRAYIRETGKLPPPPREHPCLKHDYTVALFPILKCPTLFLEESPSVLGPRPANDEMLDLDSLPPSKRRIITRQQKVGGRC